MAKRKDLRTVAVSNGIASDTAFGAVTPPIYLSSTYAFAGSSAVERTTIPARQIPVAICWQIRSPSWRGARLRWSSRREWPPSTWFSACLARMTLSWRRTIVTAARIACFRCAATAGI